VCTSRRRRPHGTGSPHIPKKWPAVHTSVAQRRRSTRASAGLRAGSFPLRCHLQRRHIENCFEALKSVLKVEPSPQGIEAAISEWVSCEKKEGFREEEQKKRERGNVDVLVAGGRSETQRSDLSGEKCPRKRRASWIHPGLGIYLTPCDTRPRCRWCHHDVTPVGSSIGTTLTEGAN
jgi:hypothetical protein